MPFLLAVFISCFALLSAASARVFDVREFGAKGDFRTKDTAAIQAAVDACHKAGGGTVLVPAGQYLSGQIELRSRITLRLEAGATIFASKEQGDYQPSPAHGRKRGALLVANNADDITVEGQGILNGQAMDDYGERWGVPEQAARFRAGIILFTECRNVKFRDIRILYSDWWTVILRRCDGVWLDSVTIFNHLKHLNSDGIDPMSCRNVHISNCRVTSGDDAIDLKTYGGFPTENVVVSNCTLETTTTGLKLGQSDSSGEFRNVHFSNITIKAPTGIGFYLVGGGNVESFTYSGISIETPKATYRQVSPIYIGIKAPQTGHVSRVRGVSFRDIFIRSGSGITMSGLGETPIENVTFDNLNFQVTEPDIYSKNQGNVKGSPNLQGANQAGTGAWITAALFKGLQMSNVTVTQPLQGGWRPAVAIRNSEDVTIHNLHGTATPGASLLDLQNSTGVNVDGKSMH